MVKILVDPNTGEIISYSQPTYDPQSFAASAGMTGLQNMGASPYGTPMAMLANFPTATTSMFWNARRGSNTLIRGGFSANEQNRGRVLRNHLSPRSFGRLSSVYNVDPAASPRRARRFGRPGDAPTYSPFNILSVGGNWAANRAAGTWVAPNLQKNDTQFSRGTLSRLSVSSRIASGGRVFRRVPGDSQLLSSIGKINPAMAPAIAGVRNLSAPSLAHFTSASMEGVLSQRFSGYMTGLMVGEPSRLAAGGLRAAGKEAYLRGVGTASQHLAAGGLDVVQDSGRSVLRYIGQETGEKIMGRGALRAGIAQAGGIGSRAGMKVAGAGALRGLGLAIPGINLAMTAVMAFDLAKMASAAFTGTLELARDAGHSFKGSIGKSVMGMGYKDNTVAATSRARGVMAIQNSRLNARSVLGSEASHLHAHFG